MQTFNRWIKNQVGRNDSTGDLAEDILRDRCWPRNGKLLDSLLDHLLYEHQAGPEALTALVKAYREWEAVNSYPEKGQARVLSTNRLFCSI